MRLAIPISDGKVSAHFGHCSHFAFYDVDPATGKIVNREMVPSPGHQPGFLPSWLAEEGVSIVIAKGMGTRAQTLFRENRIEVIVGVVDEEPEKVIRDYVNGRLATDDNICHH